MLEHLASLLAQRAALQAERLSKPAAERVLAECWQNLCYRPQAGRWREPGWRGRARQRTERKASSSASASQNSDAVLVVATAGVNVAETEAPRRGEPVGCRASVASNSYLRRGGGRVMGA